MPTSSGTLRYAKAQTQVARYLPDKSYPIRLVLVLLEERLLTTSKHQFDRSQVVHMHTARARFRSDHGTVLPPAAGWWRDVRSSAR